MALINIFARHRARPARKPARNAAPNFSPRDWADLPTYHPRREDDAV